MKLKFALSLVAVAVVLLAGCATPSHSAGCGKCSCKMMKASSTDPHKCAMCGHTKAEHDKPAEKATRPGEHVH